MPALSLRVKVTFAIVAALLAVDALGAVIAHEGFRASEERGARDRAITKADAMARVLDVRIHTLGQAAADAAEDATTRTPLEVAHSLARAGFTSYVLIGPDASLLWEGGMAAADGDLSKLLQSLAPSPEFPTRIIMFKEEHLVVAIRSLNHRYAVVGGVDRQTLMDTYFVDVLIEAEATNVIVTREGGHTVAASPNFPRESIDQTASLAGPTPEFGNGSSIIERRSLNELQGYLVHMVPRSSIDARVNELVWRFVGTATLAVLAAAAVTVLVVSYAMRPLDRITEAARKLGRGEEHLGLVASSRDEMGVLAEVLNSSAASLAEARRAQAAHAEEQARASEAFQVAVGSLARSVGEADTAPEVARRLAETALQVTPANGACVLRGTDLLEARISEGGDLDEPALRALVASDPEAFRWWDLPGENDAVRLGLLVPGHAEFRPTDSRKVDILVAQATVAFHRARIMDRQKVYVDILSHDLKNPIAVARGRVEMLAMKEPHCAEKLAIIEESLDRATRIVEEAVLFSRLERERRLGRAKVDLTALAKDAATALGPLAAQRDISVRVTAPGPVQWDANPLLCRAIENLLSNAIKWSPQGGDVQIEIAPRDTLCEIRIVDHGPGIPPEDRPRLFARFERADRSGVKGTGLGLAIAKRVVDMHDGAIRIEDTPGGGTTFVIDVPGLQKPTAPAREGSA